MQQAPFHFHCVICFDAFHPEDRPPVVLPCGHTYLCEPCSKRIKRCMECRTPLYQTTAALQQGPPGPSHQRMGSGGFNNFHTPISPAPNTPINRRYHPSPSYRYKNSLSPNPSAANKVEQIQLPCPKNLVLISIMEATQRRHLEARRRDDDPGADKENEFEVHDNNSNILDGITEVSNSSGTYVVRERNGLLVKPQRPSDADKTLTHRLDGDAETKAIHIKQGQHIQIAEEQDGAYVLARQQGFIEASNSQIVKVGPARDLSCQIEGTLCSVQNSRRILLQKAAHLEQVEGRLLEAYRDAISKPVTQAIIQTLKEDENYSGETCNSSSNLVQEKDKHGVETCLTEDSLDCKIGISETASLSIHHKSSSNEMTLSLTENDYLSPGQSIEILTPTPASPPALNHSFTNGDNHGDDGKILFMEDSVVGGLQLGIPGLSNAIDEIDLSASVVSASPGSYIVDDTQSEVGDYIRSTSRSMMCGSSIFPLLRRAWSDEDTEDQSNRSIDLTYAPNRGVPHIRPRTISQSHSSADQYPYDSSSGRSFDGVDFRTGLSGHNALNRRHTNKSHNPNGMISRREIRMMSEHRGIGSIKKVRQPQSPRS